MGKPAWDKFIPHYFTTWQRKSLDSYEFKATLLDFFKSDKASSKALESVDWETWFYKPGMPPKPKFDTSMVDKCYDLAAKWESEVCSSQSFQKVLLNRGRISNQALQTSKAGQQTRLSYS